VIGGRNCPDCRRTVGEQFEKTITGREVCPACAEALRLGTAVGVVTGDMGAAFAVHGMRVRRNPASPDAGTGEGRRDQILRVVAVFASLAMAGLVALTSNWVLAGLLVGAAAVLAYPLTRRAGRGGDPAGDGSP